jgi:hypothetical protein
MATLVVTSSSCDLISGGPRGFIKPASEIERLVRDAAEGDRAANEAMSELFDPADFPDEPINRISLDSVAFGGEKFLGVLVEFPDSRYNRFAVYDADLRLMLVDRSLEGNLFIDAASFEDKGAFSIVERRVEKEYLIHRDLRLYRVELDSAFLALNAALEYRQPTLVLARRVDTVTAEGISSTVTAPAGLDFVAGDESFVYDPERAQYVNPENRLDSLIEDLAASFDPLNERPKPKDAETFAIYPPFNAEASDVYFYAPKQWRKQNRARLSDELAKPARGARYYERGGASLYVFAIKSGERASDYADAPFVQSSEHEYRVASSEYVRRGSNMVRYVALSDGDAERFVVLVAPHTTFVQNRALYDYIVSSLRIQIP